MQYISHNIKWFRDHRRLTQQELADLLETTLGRVKSYEGGIADPPVNMLLNLAEVMNISIDALVKVQIDDSKYSGLRKDKFKEQELFKALNVVVKRLDSIEKTLARPAKKSLKYD
ncbi:MAG: helix-turn-helix transcriptional regulator [Ferruginibacter sp.]